MRVSTRLGGTIGEQLVAGGAIGDDELTDFYRTRLLVPQVNPNTLARLPVRVVAAIPSDMAIELRAIPVSLDADNNLTVAMSDPSDRHAVDEIAFFTGTYVVRAVATQMQIAWCLAHYYGHVTALGQRLLHGGAGAPVQQAPAVSPAAATVATRPAPRAKGLTGKVDALRHRAIAPITGPVNVVRPQSGEIALAAAAPLPAPEVIIVGDPPPDEAATNDGVPDRPRARSVSGEIRVPGRRAPSIKPHPEPEYEDESGPVITVEVTLPPDETPTGPRKVAPRRRNVKSDPPELAARAGEVDIDSGPVRPVDLEEPRIIIAEDALAPRSATEVNEQSGELRAAPPRMIDVSDDTSASVVIHEHLAPESQPILLERRIAHDGPTEVTSRAPSSAEDPDDEVVVLEAIKPRTPRGDRRTQVGIGILAAATRQHRDTEATGVPAMLDDPTSVDSTVAPADAQESTDETLAPPPAPPAQGDERARLGLAPRRAVAAPRAAPDATNDDAPEDDDEEQGPATAVMTAVELDDAIPQRSADILPAHLAQRSAERARLQQRIEHDEVDDGWGPPGHDDPAPAPRRHPGQRRRCGPGPDPGGRRGHRAAEHRGGGAAAPGRATSGAEASAPTTVRAIEDATSRMIELVRSLEHARDRDDVVSLMIAYLAETHRRAGFFVDQARPGEGHDRAQRVRDRASPRDAALRHAAARPAFDAPGRRRDPPALSRPDA